MSSTEEAVSSLAYASPSPFITLKNDSGRGAENSFCQDNEEAQEDLQA